MNIQISQFAIINIWYQLSPITLRIFFLTSSSSDLFKFKIKFASGEDLNTVLTKFVEPERYRFDKQNTLGSFELDLPIKISLRI